MNLKRRNFYLESALSIHYPGEMFHLILFWRYLWDQFGISHSPTCSRMYSTAAASRIKFRICNDDIRKGCECWWSIVQPWVPLHTGHWNINQKSCKLCWNNTNIIKFQFFYKLFFHYSCPQIAQGVTNAMGMICPGVYLNGL